MIEQRGYPVAEFVLEPDTLDDVGLLKFLLSGPHLKTVNVSMIGGITFGGELVSPNIPSVSFSIFNPTT